VNDENNSVPTFEILHVFMLRAPVIEVALVTVSVPSVAVPVTPALLVTVRELRAVRPCKDVLAVTVRELRVVRPCKDVLAVTVRELRVVVPVVVSAPETVTFPPADGLSTILLLDAIWRLFPELMAIEPNWVVVLATSNCVVGTPRINIPLPPFPPS
jgi:hypothetical protein